MKKILLVSLVLFAAIFSCCKSSKNNKTQVAEEKTDVMPTLTIDKSYKPDSIDYTISQVVIKGDYLIFDVTYKGGCGKHKFDLIFNGNYAKSLPVQASLHLKHTKENETCNNDITEPLRFDISKVRYSNKKEVVLKISSSKEKFNYIY
jgi:hypothetical protein